MPDPGSHSTLRAAFLINFRQFAVPRATLVALPLACVVRRLKHLWTVRVPFSQASVMFDNTAQHPTHYRTPPRQQQYLSSLAPWFVSDARDAA